MSESTEANGITLQGLDLSGLRLTEGEGSLYAGTLRLSFSAVDETRHKFQISDGHLTNAGVRAWNSLATMSDEDLAPSVGLKNKNYHANMANDYIRSAISDYLTKFTSSQLKEEPVDKETLTFNQSESPLSSAICKTDGLHVGLQFYPFKLHQDAQDGVHRESSVNHGDLIVDATHDPEIFFGDEWPYSKDKSLVCPGTVRLYTSKGPEYNLTLDLRDSLSRFMEDYLNDEVPDQKTKDQLEYLGHHGELLPQLQETVRTKAQEWLQSQGLTCKTIRNQGDLRPFVHDQISSRYSEIPPLTTVNVSAAALSWSKIHVTSSGTELGENTYKRKMRGIVTSMIEDMLSHPDVQPPPESDQQALKVWSDVMVNMVQDHDFTNFSEDECEDLFGKNATLGFSLEVQRDDETDKATRLDMESKTSVTIKSKIYPVDAPGDPERAVHDTFTYHIGPRSFKVRDHSL